MRLTQDELKRSKRSCWKQALSVMTTHYAIVIPASLLAHDWMVAFAGYTHTNAGESEGSHEQATNGSWFACANPAMTRIWEPEEARMMAKVALFLALYSCWFLPWRWYSFPRHIPQPLRTAVIYEFTWLCNVTLVLSSVAFFTRRPLLSVSYCLSVGIDQLLWYFDLFTKLISGKCLIGVCSYVFSADQTFSTRLTCTHHLWTIPLVTYVTRGVHPLAWPLSLCYTTLNVVLSRLLVPSHLEYQAKDGEEIVRKYMNVNLGHELWRDVTIKALQINHGNPSCAVYLFRLLWRWLGFQSLVFGFLYTLFNFFTQYRSPLC